MAPQDARRYDFGIFPLGFEPPVSSGASALADVGFSIDRALIPTYEANQAANDRQRLSLERAVDRMLVNGRRESISAGETIVAQLRTELIKHPGASVVFDISGASNTLIQRLMWLLLQIDIDLTVIYSEASTYYPTKSRYAEAKRNDSAKLLELSAGPHVLESAVEHPGELEEAARDIVILLPGFDSDRARKVINLVDPSLLLSGQDQVIWLMGNPKLAKDAWRAEWMMALHDVGDGRHWRKYQFIDTFDYVGAWRALEELYQRYSYSNRLTLSPMGSKMQAIGCALFCTSRPDVRVVFATPSEYRAELFTRGCRQVWLLPLGSTKNLRETVQSVGQLEVYTNRQEALLRRYRRVDWG